MRPLLLVDVDGVLSLFGFSGAPPAELGADRPVAWIDDAFDATCAAWAADRPGPTLLVLTDPATGLRAEHVTQLESWAVRL